MEGHGGAVLSSRPPAAIIKVSLYVRNWTAANRWIALEVGQLVKDDFFTLFESIGAIEVAGYRCSSHYPLLMN
jgi:hypothetical protein